MITLDLAEELDQILSGVPDVGGIHVHKVNKVSFEILGDRLEKDGNGKWLGGYEFQVYSRGTEYLKTGGYTKLYHQTMLRIKNSQHKQKLRRKQINAIRREPYLIAWGIIATILVVILAISK